MVFRHDDLPEVPDPGFVEFTHADKISPHRNASPEVKRATIVGNPMFSLDGNDSSNTQQDVVGLEDLNLGMDYDQIMQYFDNLKESNA